MHEKDEPYLAIILGKLDICRKYQPKFGTGHAVTLDEFKAMYGQDPFYSWFGLDNPMLYAAHKAAGGLTSIYRQIGIGCEQVFRVVLQTELGLSDEQVAWSYDVLLESGRTRTLSLDGRIVYEHITDSVKRDRVKHWVHALAAKLGVASSIIQALDGAVFEVRQGYKSKDSKRQNADINNITNAYTHGYFPVFSVLSTQIDNDIAIRYRNSKCPVLVGSLSESPFESTYAFCKQVIGYDLAAFFERNSTILSKAIEEVMEVLLDLTR